MHTVLLILVLWIESPNLFDHKEQLICDNFGCYLQNFYVWVPSKILIVGWTSKIYILLLLSKN